MSKTVEFTRAGKVITAKDGTVQNFPSISKAKKWSRDWQKANGGLGVGLLRRG